MPFVTYAIWSNISSVVDLPVRLYAPTGLIQAGYTPVLSGDFTGDGTSDIAWYNPTTRDLEIWKLNSNGQWAGSYNIGSHPPGSVAVGVGDFDHNGVADIMWHNTATGSIENWMLAFR